jgi:uncharacterized protein YkwD
VAPRPVLLLVVIAALVLSDFAGLAKPSEASAGTPTRAEKILIRAVNYARTSRGYRRLYVGSTIQSGAHRWAAYLLAKDAFYHGSLPSGVRENIAWLTCRRGWQRTIVKMWLNSWAHRVALLDRSARRIGVGVATGRWNGYRCVRMAVARLR